MDSPLSVLAADLQAADVMDALGRMHRHRAHLTGLVSPTPSKTLFGPAVTISYFPSCAEARPADRYNFAELFYQAIGDSGDGKVLVLASNGYTEASLGGGIKMSRVHNHGMAGIFSDGRLRDFEELAGYDFVTYCRGEAVRWGGDTVTPFEANRPVVLSGVGIHPGDYIFADSSGAVAIPAGQVREVLEEARRIRDADRAALDRIRQEKPASLRGADEV